MNTKWGLEIRHLQDGPCYVKYSLTMKQSGPCRHVDSRFTPFANWNKKYICNIRNIQLNISITRKEAITNESSAFYQCVKLLDRRRFRYVKLLNRRYNFLSVIAPSLNFVTHILPGTAGNNFSHLVKDSPFYETQKFMTVIVETNNWIISQAKGVSASASLKHSILSRVRRVRVTKWRFLVRMIGFY
jgi:hypothetical protein